MKRFLSVVIGLFLLGSLNVKLSAQILEVRIGVDGMYWGLWAFGVKKALKRLEGVQNVEVSLETQSAKVIIKPGEILKLKKLRQAIKKADYTPGDIRLKAKGGIAANSDKKTSEIADLAFKIPGSGQVFLLVSPPAEKSSKDKAQPDLLPKLREVFKVGTRKFIIIGRVHEHKEFPVGLSVQEFEVAQQGKVEKWGPQNLQSCFQ